MSFIGTFLERSRSVAQLSNYSKLLARVGASSSSPPAWRCADPWQCARVPKARVPALARHTRPLPPSANPRNREQAYGLRLRFHGHVEYLYGRYGPRAMGADIPR